MSHREVMAESGVVWPSQGLTEATRGRERQGLDSPPHPLKSVSPFHHFDVSVLSLVFESWPPNCGELSSFVLTCRVWGDLVRWPQLGVGGGPPHPRVPILEQKPRAQQL